MNMDVKINDVILHEYEMGWELLVASKLGASSIDCIRIATSDSSFRINVMVCFDYLNLPDSRYIGNLNEINIRHLEKQYPEYFL